MFPTGHSVAGDHAASLIQDELGPRSSSIAAAVASATGVKAASAQKLMGGVATVAVAALAKSSGGLGAGALQSMFREQRSQWVSKLPGPVASLFNGHARPAVVPVERGYEERVVTGPAIRELEAPRRNWMIPLILVALALLAHSGAARAASSEDAGGCREAADHGARSGPARARGESAGRGDARAGARGGRPPRPQRSRAASRTWPPTCRARARRRRTRSRRRR